MVRWNGIREGWSKGRYGIGKLFGLWGRCFLRWLLINFFFFRFLFTVFGEFFRIKGLRRKSLFWFIYDFV